MSHQTVLADLSLSLLFALLVTQETIKPYEIQQAQQLDAKALVRDKYNTTVFVVGDDSYIIDGETIPAKSAALLAQRFGPRNNIRLIIDANVTALHVAELQSTLNAAEVDYVTFFGEQR